MKHLFSLLVFNFLCVWCFGFEDCKEVRVTCSESDAPPPSELAVTSIPYVENDRILTFRSIRGNEVLYKVNRADFIEFLPTGVCQWQFFFGFRSTAESEPLGLQASLFGDSTIYHCFLKEGPGEFALVDVALDTNLNNSNDFLVAQEGQRIVNDTMLEGGSYQKVLVSDLLTSDFYKTVFYTKEEGFVQFDLTDGDKLFLAN